jgi:mRNA interferase MazF
MVAKTVAPDRGDIVWISLNPQAGHEQAGRRPVLVVSPLAYNQRVGLALCCPITSQQKGYPFEVELPADALVRGVILADQVKCLDWRARKAEVAGTVSSDVIAETLGKLASLLQ